MTHSPHGWRRSPPIPAPPPPSDTNGWGRYVAVTIEHLLTRLHYLEQMLHEHKDQHHAAPPAMPPSSKDVWAERKETAREVGTALRWLTAIILLLLVGLQKLEISQLPTLGKLFGGGA